VDVAVKAGTVAVGVAVTVSTGVVLGVPVMLGDADQVALKVGVSVAVDPDGGA